MGRFDLCLKRVFSKPRFFAAVFNGFYYKGRQVILPEQLTDQPVQEAYFTTCQEKEKETKFFLKERDLLKVAAFKKGIKESFLILGIEGQSFVDPFMALRVVIYDLFNYIFQWEEIKDRNKRGNFKTSIAMHVDMNTLALTTPLAARSCGFEPLP